MWKKEGVASKPDLRPQGANATPEHEHTRDAIRLRLAQARRPNYLRDWVYGGIDGTVTTFAVVAGVAGAQLSPRVVIIIGLANIFADGFSMAASNYSATKTEVDDDQRLREVERRHIALCPEGEREEVRQILAAKGLSGSILERAVAAITSNEKTWIDTMLVDEYGVGPSIRSPLLAAMHTFLAFLVCGAIPLIPYLFGLGTPLLTASLMTAAVFFAIGSAKSLWSLDHWLKSGLETLTIGIGAALLAYLIGHALQGFAFAAG
jgi:VIT1/CCC1 family predicted Fe2+/Mn2+ transporter